MRKLRIQRETLRQLDAGELGKAGGGQTQWTPVINTYPVNGCVSYRVTCPASLRCTPYIG
jgi:hypothetical protein